MEEPQIKSTREEPEANLSNDQSNGSAADGWYPGKYLGRKKEEKTLNTLIEEKEQEKAGDEEETKKESMICSTVRSIRTKYLERQLIGRIYIYRLSGVISTAVTSEVTSEDVMNYYLSKAERNGQNSVYEDDALIQAEVTGQYKRALSTVDAILNSLERRSLAYSTADFSHTTLLTRGTTLGVSDPFFGIIGFSFTLELSATAHSLLASRRRYEIARDLALDLQRKEAEEEKERLSSSSSSSFSRISFSLFGKKSEKTLEEVHEEDSVSS
jgi:hypothetical protein